jgi:hypothetical protein
VNANSCVTRFGIDSMSSNEDFVMTMNIGNVLVFKYNTRQFTRRSK